MAIKDEEEYIGEAAHVEQKDSYGDTSSLTREDLELLLVRLARQDDKAAAAGVPSREPFGNSVPLGLSAFALTTFVLGIITVGAGGVEVPQVVNTLAFFYGGAAQFMAGMWGFANRNTFAGVAFSSYGPFWMAYAALTTDSFGIPQAYEGNEEMLNRAIAYFLFAWFIFSFFLLLCMLRTTVGMVTLLVVLEITFLLLAIGKYTGNTKVDEAGGYFAIILSFVAWYIAYGLVRTEIPEVTMVPYYDAKMPW